MAWASVLVAICCSFRRMVVATVRKCARLTPLKSATLFVGLPFDLLAVPVTTSSPINASSGPKDLSSGSTS